MSSMDNEQSTVVNDTVEQSAPPTPMDSPKDNPQGHNTPIPPEAATAALPDRSPDTSKLAEELVDLRDHVVPRMIMEALEDFAPAIADKLRIILSYLEVTHRGITAAVNLDEE